MKKKVKQKNSLKKNYLPVLLRRGAILGMVFLVFLSFLVANFQALLWQTSDWLVGAILPAVVVDLTNDEREALAAPPLGRNLLLDQAAKLKAEDMAAGEYFSHNSPTGVTPWHWFKEVGYVYAHAGENLAVFFSDSDEVVKAWMNSPSHRANIVNTAYQEIGIGTAKGRYQGHDTVFVVQLFGTPAQINPVLAKVDPEPKVVNEEVVLTESLDTSSADIAINSVPTSPDDNDTLVLGAEVDPEADIDVVPIAVTQELEVKKTEMEEKAVEDLMSTESLFLSPVATSSGLLPVLARIEAVNENTAFGASLATQPNKLLRYLYLLVGTLTIVALWSSVWFAWRQRQLVDVSYGVALLLLMCGLFYVHQLLTSGALIV